MYLSNGIGRVLSKNVMEATVNNLGDPSIEKLIAVLTKSHKATELRQQF